MANTTYLKAVDKPAATRVMVWFLVNLLLLPGVGFVVVAWYFLRLNKIPDLTEDGAAYVRSAFFASCIGGGLIILGCGAMYLSVTDPLQSWPLIIVYFTVMHSVFILWGILNLARALAGRTIAIFGIDL